MIFNTVALVSAVSALTFPIVSEPLTTFTSCGGSQDTFVLNTVDITPYPMTKGSPIAVVIAGNLSQNVTQGAKVSLSLKDGFLPLYSGTVDFCDELAKAKLGVACPLAAGPQSFSTSQTIPGIVPGGTYTINIKVANADGSEAACINGKIEIK